jgi:hypothetical protein
LTASLKHHFVNLIPIDHSVRELLAHETRLPIGIASSHPSGMTEDKSGRKRREKTRWK